MLLLVALALLVVVVIVVPIALLRQRAGAGVAACTMGAATDLLLSRPFVLVHAHADDEVMFFLPTLQLLRARLPPALYAQSTVVCLTSNPLLRATEYGACAAQLLGLAPAQVRVVHCPVRDECTERAECPEATLVDVERETGLWDGFAHRYAAETVADVLVRALPRGLDWGAVNFVTFDARGVSGHPNHIDVARGVRHACSVHGATVFALDSVPCIVKYVPALFSLRFAQVVAAGENKRGKEAEEVVAVCSATARKTMLHALRHVYRSQLVWYRCCFAVISMYAYCNTLRIVHC